MAQENTRRRNRPSALDVSFADDPDIQMLGPVHQADPVTTLKRGLPQHSDAKRAKNKRPHVLTRTEIPPLPNIIKPSDSNCIIDSDVGHFLFDEESGNAISNSGENQDALGNRQRKPIRLLDDFTFVNASDDYLIPLQVGVERSLRHFRGEGLVSMHTSSTDNTDEDEGQDDELVDDTIEGIRMVLKEVLSVRVDFEGKTFVETPVALYLLKEPAIDYRVFHERFMHLVNLTSLFVTVCRKNRENADVRRLLAEKEPYKGAYSGEYTMGDAVEAIPLFKYALTFLHDCHKLRSHPNFKKLCLKLHLDLPNPNPSIGFPLKITDVSVLDPANQTTTVVTPHLGELATGLFHEEMDAVGKQRKIPESQAHQCHEQWFERLQANVGRRKSIKYPWRSQEYVRIDDVEYRPGDALFVSADLSLPERSRGRNSDPVTTNSILFDHFWMALVVALDKDTNTLHVVWLEHSSQTLLGEISDPQMVFLTDICDRLPMQCVVDKATVNFAFLSSDQLGALGAHEFYCWLKYNANDGSMNSFDILELRSTIEMRQCKICLDSDREDKNAIVESDGGLLFHDQRFHINDFVLIRREADDGPANIGRIIRMASPRAIHRWDKEPYQVTVLKLGRIRDVHNLPEDMVRDERHLFLTNDRMTIPAERLITVVYVLHKERIPNLDVWLDHSPHHFYIQYHIPLQEDFYNWSVHEVISPDAEHLGPCAECYKARFNEIRQLHRFKSRKRLDPLRTLDLFSGVGSFSAGIAEGTGGCIRVTHSIEIAPSAAKTCARNFPSTKVYNQCANIVLKWCIKSHYGFDVERPRPIIDNGKPLDDPIKPGDIDVIICGVPCQPHSGLNMYKRANDRKSHLLVNFLSWVDFLKPRFVFMENVRGFTTFRLNAMQYDKYRVGGGIEAGGLKFVHHALTQLGYQVRCGLLQAGHYGVPQTRVRFFLVGAKNGEKLPQFPQPSHDFPRVDSLEITIPRPPKGMIGSIWATRGTAAHHFVSIIDAIGDLPPFDWKYPGLEKEPGEFEKVAAQRRTLKIPRFECHDKSVKCGFTGTAKYPKKPRTRFQLFSREISTEDIQHFTANFDERRVKQVLSIPLKANADYRSIPQHLGDWMLTNQSSALARQGYKPGKYFGRLDKNAWFNTTVTNLHPTAKQSKVLHPTDRRMYTVREFARSMSFRDEFVFESIDDSVNTLHRQIGNAVPWLLAKAIGAEFLRTLFEQEQEERRE